VRTTIDLPDDLRALARQLAHDNQRSMSDVVADPVRPECHVHGRAMVASW
jgi:hypothetical protein